jgi:ferredoxin
MPKVTFIQKDVLQEVPYGMDFQKIHEIYHQLPLKFGCRQGRCAVCAIKVVCGAANLSRCGARELAVLEAKGLAGSGYRLACQCAINGDVVIE